MDANETERGQEGASADEIKARVAAGYDRVSYAYRGDDAPDPAEPAAAGGAPAWLSERLPAGARVLDLGCGNGLPAAAALLAAAEQAGRPLARYLGVDLSPVQVERARRLVPAAEFRCADMAALDFPPASFDAVLALYSLIHLPLDEQPPLLARIAGWLAPGGLFAAVLGHTAWTGAEEDWLGVPGATMYWSHAGAADYRAWLAAAGLTIEEERFIPEGDGGHALFLCRK